MKRFTDTAKWAKTWFQDLPPRLKCFWQFLCDNADAAGVWEPNFKLASFQIGEAVSEKDLEYFGSRIEPLESGKLRIISFIEFQYGKLSSDCKAHIPVFRLLEKHRLSIPYPKAMHSLQEEEEETEEERRGSAEGGRFADFWQEYPRRVGRANAEAAWKRNGCPAIAVRIISAVRVCKKSEDWTRDRGKFIPHPDKWLDRKGWEDELVQIRKNGSSGEFVGETNAQRTARFKREHEAEKNRST